MISKNGGEERVKIKGGRLCCCLVHVKRGSGCGRLTGCLDKYFGGRTYISDGTFFFYSRDQELQRYCQGRAKLYKSGQAFLSV